MHRAIPQKVGSRNAINPHLKFPLSFFILIKVVPQGKCNKVNNITLIPVRMVHPFCLRISPIAKVVFISTKFPVDKYDIKIIGKTISFAGIPKINAIKIYPSNPIILAKGSRKLAICERIDKLPIVIFANNHIIIPKGAATAIALPSTNKVLSKIDLVIICIICGFL